MPIKLSTQKSPQVEFRFYYLRHFFVDFSETLHKHGYRSIRIPHAVFERVISRLRVR